MMVKAVRVMLKPNNVQQTKMFQYAGAARFAYNWALAKEKDNYEKGGRFISDSELRKEFTRLRNSAEYAWLQNVSNNVTKQAIKDACIAYKNFFKSLQKHPRFKSKKKSTPKFYQDSIKIQFSDTHVKFEGFSSSRKANKQKLNWVRLAEHGRIPTDAKKNINKSQVVKKLEKCRRRLQRRVSRKYEKIGNCETRDARSHA